MNASEVRNGYHRAKWALVVRGLLALTLGLYILARPLDSVATLALVVGVWALVDGFVMIVHAFDLRAIAGHWRAMLLSGIVSAAFGVAALDHNPTLSLTFVVAWTSLWLLTGGTFALFAAVQERRLGVGWEMTMLFGAISVIVGLLALVYPDITVAALMAVIATFGVAGGTTLLVTAVRLQNVERRIGRSGPSLRGAGQP